MQKKKMIRFVVTPSRRAGGRYIWAWERGTTSPCEQQTIVIFVVLPFLVMLVPLFLFLLLKICGSIFVGNRKFVPLLIFLIIFLIVFLIVFVLFFSLIIVILVNPRDRGSPYAFA